MIVSTGVFPDAVIIDDMASTLDIIRAYLKGHFDSVDMSSDEILKMIDDSLGMVHEVEGPETRIELGDEE